MTKLDLFVIISSISLIFSMIGTILGLVAVIKVSAMERSTHTVTYQAIDEEIEKANNAYLKDPWATKESTIAEDQKEFKEDLESEMPEFYPDEDDEKVYSF